MQIKNQKGQVTIFIIIGVVIFVAILSLLYFMGQISFTKSPAENPEAYLRNCMLTSSKEAESLLLESNAYPQLDSDNYILFNKEKIPYLCTVSEFYSACIPQEPAFFSYVSNLIQNKVVRDTEECLRTLVKDLEKKGYEVTIDEGEIKTKIQKDFISATLGKRIHATRGDDAIQISNIDGSYGTNFYDLIKLVQTIVNYESTICEFNKMNWMRLDNSIIISTTRTSDQTKVYTLRERLTEREIKFAIKTCILPAGI